MKLTAEHQRLTEYRDRKANWKKWGPYLSERAWGTVREDYSPDGAAWDLAFHCIPLALVDADFAKRQLDLMAREWYLHPNGQLPAYEWKFGDVNPPVHGWAAWRVYKIDAKQQGRADRCFLEGIYHKLLLNFTWWVNKKDTEGRNVFIKPVGRGWWPN